jgi:hypothetical protein
MPVLLGGELRCPESVKYVPGVVCSLFIVLFQLLVNILFLRFAALRNSQKYIFPKLKSLQVLFFVSCLKGQVEKYVNVEACNCLRCSYLIKMKCRIFVMDLPNIFPVQDNYPGLPLLSN